MPSLISRYRALPAYKRWYVAGTATTIAFGLLAYLFPGSVLAIAPFFCPIPALFSIGFLVWAMPAVRLAWGNPMGKLFISLGHLLALLFAAVVAREAVSASLGLPPQDFELTVQFVVLLVYVPVLAVLAAICLLLVSLGLLLCGSISELVMPKSEFTTHALGALALCFVVLVAVALMATAGSTVASAIRWVAFFADFHYAPAYPGVDAKARAFACMRTGLYLLRVLRTARFR
jgi:hypothetical protein